jgi:F-type H+-transporting ATPase subunit a
MSIKNFASPLEQFEILYSFVGLNIDIIAFFLIITSAICWNTLQEDWRGASVITNIVYAIFNLVTTLSRENLNLVRQYYVGNFLFLFQVIFLMNFTGLIPYAYTMTSSFVVTFMIALTYFNALNLNGLWTLKYKMFNLFLPGGTPLPISPFLTIIEFISYIARVLSLSIRLFANMMSGHALLKILITLAYAMMSAATISIIVVVPWIVVSSIFTLEILIAFLQAYVFTVLVILYNTDTITSH